MLSMVPVILLALALALSGAATGLAADTEITRKFIEAYDAKDAAGMHAVVQENLDAVPAEVQKLLDEAALPETTAERSEEALFLAELIATKFKDITEETGPLIEVKKAVFNSKLSAPVRGEPKDGVYIIDMPEATEHEMNVFRPDNLIVKVGSTVRWVNNDKIAHVFASMPMIGEGGIFASNIDPDGGIWEHTFTKPGEYYYICFIHRGMVGRVTVEAEGGATEAGAGAPAQPAPAEKAPAKAPAAAPEKKPAKGEEKPEPPKGLGVE